ncbi:hypothetical protein BGZ94_000774 [Podila epigama]|nr:hypothetical protein BGZ94_000774 [Podila epigama]
MAQHTDNPVLATMQRIQINQLPSDIFHRIMYALDLTFSHENYADIKFRVALRTCMKVCRRWYTEIKPLLWASIRIRRRTHHALATFFQNNRALVRDIDIDLEHSSISCHDSFDPSTFRPDREWHGVILMHSIFTPNTELLAQMDAKATTWVDAIQHDDITAKIMNDWLLNQTKGWSLWPPPRSTTAPIFFPFVETLSLSKIDFSQQSGARYLRSILEGLPQLRHLTMDTLKNVCLVTHNLVLPRLQSLTLKRVEAHCKDLLNLLSVRCTPRLDRIRMKLLRLPRQNRLEILDMLLEHGDKDGRCKDSLPIRHIDGLDCHSHRDEDLAAFFELLPRNSLKSLALHRGLLIREQTMKSLIEHHGESLQSFYCTNDFNFSNAILQDLVTRLPNLRLLGLERVGQFSSLFFDTDRKVPWACTQLERLSLEVRSRREMPRLTEVLANLELRDPHSIETTGRVLKHGSAMQASSRRIPAVSESEMCEREILFYERICGLKKLRDLRLEGDVWSDVETRELNKRLERRYGVNGAIGRERGADFRTPEHPERGGEYKFYGWDKITLWELS